MEGQPKGEARSESAAGSPFIQKEKKEYMRFDIIEGKHRIVTL